MYNQLVPCEEYKLIILNAPFADNLSDIELTEHLVQDI